MREESVLARIRIGHTNLTHCFHSTKADPSKCGACDCQLTVKHIFLKRVDFIETNIFKTAFYLIYMNLVCFTDG